MGREPRDYTDTWFFFGDSVTLGVNDTEQPGGFVSRLVLLGAEKGLCQYPPATFYNLGARRQKIAQIDARFEQEYTARLMPGIRSRLVFCAGTVDIMSGSAVPTLEEDLARLLGHAKNIAPALFICPPPALSEAHNQNLQAYALMAEGLCKSLNVPCVNIFDKLMANRLPELITDAVHPGPKGNALIAGLLLEEPVIRSFLTMPD